MNDIERAGHTIPFIESIIAEIPKIKDHADVGQLSPPEFDDWLKHNIVKFRYPLLGAAVIYTGWMTYRFIRKILNKNIPKP